MGERQRARLDIAKNRAAATAAQQKSIKEALAEVANSKTRSTASIHSHNKMSPSSNTESPSSSSPAAMNLINKYLRP